jgi:3D (Asp-Asp-Asp) domain-containing protein
VPVIETRNNRKALMKRTLACLAALALTAFSGAARAQSPDPIGDLINRAAPLMGAPDWQLKATLYHAGAKGIRGLDSLGCKVSPMRTLAVDPSFIPRRTVVFIKETVGMILPGGGTHDGYWYASDIGGAIKGKRIDMFTGVGAGSMKQFFSRGINAGAVSATKVGTFKGCPPV